MYQLCMSAQFLTTSTLKQFQFIMFTIILFCLFSFVFDIGTCQSKAYLMLYECTPSLAQQQWTVSNTANYSVIQLKNQSYCIDCNGGDIDVNPWTFSCHGNDNSAINQWWTFLDSSNKRVTNLTDESVTIASYAQSDNNCLAVSETTMSFGTVAMKQCHRNKRQLFKYDSDTYQFQLAINDSLCLTQNFEVTPNGNCSVAPFSNYPYCDQGIYVYMIHLLKYRMHFCWCLRGV